MAEFPALTLWTDAYLSDTRRLSTLEHGAYLLLLMEAWRRPHCDLPDDDRILARLAGLSIDEWAEIKDTILSYWIYDGRSKVWRQKRLLRERDQARRRSKVASDNSAKRWNKNKKDNAAALPDAMPNECPDDPTHCSLLTDSRDNEDRSEKEPLPPSGRKKRGDYVFSGSVIRLSAADFDRWTSTYHGIADLRAELETLDVWIKDQPAETHKRWFHVVSGILNKKHQAGLAALKENREAKGGNVTADGWEMPLA